MLMAVLMVLLPTYPYLVAHCFAHSDLYVWFSVKTRVLHYIQGQQLGEQSWVHLYLH